ncbi:MAG TPA: hypothetical protein VNM46_10845, partial [Xanthobacteraceae bacterium]|nr:hypothetical protein [Xanthobacteraceae bacterium]
SISVSWTQDARDGARVVWEEQGGPPVREPQRKGFGQVVFERIGASLDGNIATEFRPEGFVCSVTIAANNLIPAGRLATVSSVEPQAAVH